MVTGRQSMQAFLTGLLVFALAFGVYALTLHPSVAGGDAGELITSVFRLEIAHPPGYPLYSLLNHPLTWLPFGSVAWRVNLGSALAGAGAVAALFRLLCRLAVPAWAAACMALCFGFCPLIWTWASSAEVFALNNLLLLLLLHQSLTCLTRATKGSFAGLAFVAGLAATNHQISLLIALPLLLATALARRGRLLNLPTLCLGALAGLVGLLPYLWLAVASTWSTHWSWGDAGTPGGFLDLLLRADYGTFQLGADGASAGQLFTAHWRVFFQTLRENLGFGGLALASLGLAGSLFSSSRRSEFLAISFVAAFFYLVVFHWLANLPVEITLYRGVTERFWQQALVFVFLWAAVGLSMLLGWVLARLPPRAKVLTPLLASFLVVFQLSANFRAQDQSENTVVASWGRALLQELPEDALLLVYGDLTSNALRYLQACESLRSDVVVLDQELMTKPWFVERAAVSFPDLAFPGRAYHPRKEGHFSIEQFLAANPPGRSVFVYPSFKDGDESWHLRRSLVPLSIAARVETLATNQGSASARAARFEQVAGAGSALGELALGPMAGTSYSDRGWEVVVGEELRAATLRRASWLREHVGDARNPEAGALAVLRVWREVTDAFPKPTPWWLAKSLGHAAATALPYEPAALPLAIGAWQRYLAAAPPDDGDRAKIAAWLEEVTARSSAATDDSDRKAVDPT